MTNRERWAAQARRMLITEMKEIGLIGRACNIGPEDTPKNVHHRYVARRLLERAIGAVVSESLRGGDLE